MKGSLNISVATKSFLSIHAVGITNTKKGSIVDMMHCGGLLPITISALGCSYGGTALKHREVRSNVLYAMTLCAIPYNIADTQKLNVIKSHKKKTNNQRSPISTYKSNWL